MTVAMLYERDVPTIVAPVNVLVMGAFMGAVSGLLVTKIRILSSWCRPACCRSSPASRSRLPTPGQFQFSTIPFGFVLERLVRRRTGADLFDARPHGARTLSAAPDAVRPQDLRDRRKSNRGAVLGIRTDRTKIAAFVLSGVTASLAGMILGARSTAGNPSLGAGLELDVIAAVIIGATSLFGGYGSIVVGAMFIGIPGFGLPVIGLRTSIQEVIKGHDHSSGGVGKPPAPGALGRSAATYAPRRFWLSEFEQDG